MNESRNFYGNAAGTRLFFSEKDSDVSIRVEWEGQKWHFPAHKLVLCVMSDVFRTMLETDMIEKSSSTITIRDCSPFTVKQFLKCMALSRTNVLSAMEPFLKYIRWALIPESHRTFVPRLLADKYRDEELPLRRAFRVPTSLQYHINYVKFVVELGAYHDPIPSNEQNICISKFTVDNHVFMAGFRIVGLFKTKTTFLSSPCCITLSREENKTLIQFNLNSLSWTRGANAGTEIWHEMIAYLPFPIRLDPFSTYTLTMRMRRNKELEFAKWPRTRLDSEIITSDLGNIVFKSFGHCFGLTQLFILPASPYRNICNTEFD
ncbi:unnamed protein product [Larinioides sclopetarius]|uniref:BTB domain-containing protein n=1 Tax=Larinioides sclopetarius TaxID=280406 RepID=A0AAV2A692_9ARAC